MSRCLHDYRSEPSHTKPREVDRSIKATMWGKSHVVDPMKSLKSVRVCASGRFVYRFVDEDLESFNLILAQAWCLPELWVVIAICCVALQLYFRRCADEKLNAEPKPKRPTIHRHMPLVATECLLKLRIRIVKRPSPSFVGDGFEPLTQKGRLVPRQQWTQ